ncbi:MAG TPA: hypothetical protein VJU84_00685 [Pyrinomonadaceae bacterium]|nr:hypothetical protein [Pyrinomonadaceae bacterium]
MRDPLKDHIASTLSIDDLMLRVQTDPHWWVMSESQAPIIPFDQFQIFGPLNASEASQHTSDPITKAIATANSQIRDLAFLTTYFQHDGYQDLTSVRELKMLVLDIENVGDKPIGLVALKQKVAQTDQAYRLVSRAEQQTTLSKATIAETALPLELLRPNEHLFVPLSIEFGFATNPLNREIWNQEQYMEKSRLPKDWWTSRVEEAIPFELVRGADRRGYPIISIVTISKSNLDSKPPFESHIEPTYFIGSSIDVQEVVFRTGNGIPTPWKVRRFEPNNLIARGAFEGGSCPILFYKGGVSGTVKRIGPILINAVTRSRQQTVQILVNGNVDTFVLEESQPETSFIDQVSLEVTDENGRRSIVSAEENTLIRRLDRRFAILRQGSKLHINFRVPEHLKKANRQLKISGFYIPDSMIKD